MSTPASAIRPLAGLKQALRQCRAERQRCRRYATVAEENIAAHPDGTAYDMDFPWQNTERYTAEKAAEKAKKSSYARPSPGFRPSQAIKQNRFEVGLRKIPVYPPPRSTIKQCPDPISVLFKDQLKVLDPTGARTRLFAPDNLERVKVGDILLVRLKSGDPFSGVVLNIRQRHSQIDTAILLRNQLTRVSVEMWFKVYSPNVEGIEIVQRREKRARRAKLYYMRKPKHDMGSVENIVRQYMRMRAGGPTAIKGTKAKAAQKKKKKGKKK